MYILLNNFRSLCGDPTEKKARVIIICPQRNLKLVSAVPKSCIILKSIKDVNKR